MKFIILLGLCLLMTSCIVKDTTENNNAQLFSRCQDNRENYWNNELQNCIPVERLRGCYVLEEFERVQFHYDNLPEQFNALRGKYKTRIECTSGSTINKEGEMTDYYISFDAMENYHIVEPCEIKYYYLENNWSDNTMRVCFKNENSS